MSELTEIFKRVSIENLVSYFLYGVDSSHQVFEDYEEKLQGSFDELFGELESMYDKADRNDNRLFNVIVDFATLHEVTYFETGVLVGAELIRNLEQGFCKDSENHYENSRNLNYKEGKQSVLRQFIHDRMDTALEETLQEDKRFQQVNEQIHIEIEKASRDKFSHEQWQLVDNALSACNERSSEYGVMAYQQGLLDTLNFIQDIMLMK